jgi:exopolyphosphatase/guanosine-5'-triphosphate,3'-diphosphate pyrophosphatase
MKICIIDIGSNSVRLAMIADGKTLYKRLATTRLGEGLTFTGKISTDAMGRTVKALNDFKEFAKEEGAEKLFAFATAAVRSASNREEFLSLVKSECGIEIEVISGENEAKLGMYGVLSAFPERQKGKYSGIIDVGGASTEITIQTEGKIVYTKSVDIGTVRLFDLAARDRKKLEKVIDEKIAQYMCPFNGKDFSLKMFAIGGTGTTIASTLQQLPVYLPEKVNGYTFNISDLSALTDKLFSLSVEEIRTLAGMEPRRVDVISGGVLLLLKIARLLKLENITVSESDNIEGYYLLKEGKV